MLSSNSGDTNSGNTTPISSHLTYAHDANDNITGITDVVTPAASRSFGYDPVDRIAAHYGNLTGATGTPMVQENYAHDKNGNRTAVTRRAVADSASTSETDSYTKAPDANRLTSVTSAAGTPKVEALCLDVINWSRITQINLKVILQPAFTHISLDLRLTPSIAVRAAA